MASNILNVVVGSPIKDGRCVLIQRIKEPYKGMWALPGGKLEHGEFIGEAIEREIMEETGATVRYTGLHGVVNEVMREHATGMPTNHFIIWACALEHVGNEFEEQKEGTLRWFSESELDAQRSHIVPSDYLMLKRFFFSATGHIPIHSVTMRSLENGEYEIEYTDL